MFRSEFKREKAGNPVEAVKTATDKTNLEMGMRVMGQAKLLAPVNKKIGEGGRLRNSISVTSRHAEHKGFNDSPGDRADNKLSTQGLTEGDVYVGCNLDYAVHQEYGTMRMAAQPFLRPSVDIEVKGESIQSVMKRYSDEQMRKELAMRQEDI